MAFLSSISLAKKLILAFAGTAALSVTAAAIGVIGFDNTRAAEATISDQGVPVMSAAQQLARLTSGILEVPFVLRRAPTEPARQTMMKSLHQRAEAVKLALDDLGKRGFNPDLVARLRQSIGGIVEGIDQLGNGVAGMIPLTKAVNDGATTTLKTLKDITDISTGLSASANTTVKNALSGFHGLLDNQDEAAKALDALLRDDMPQADRMTTMRSSSLILTDIVSRLARETTVDAVD